jgi:hypothetical protein
MAQQQRIQNGLEALSRYALPLTVAVIGLQMTMYNVKVVLCYYREANELSFLTDGRVLKQGLLGRAPIS